MSPESSSLTRRIVELAWPVLIAQLSSMTQMVSDTVLAGRYALKTWLRSLWPAAFTSRWSC